MGVADIRRGKYILWHTISDDCKVNDEIKALKTGKEKGVYLSGQTFSPKMKQ